jgi:hypothetical protein
VRCAVVVLVALAAIAHADDTRDAIERARELEAKLAYDEALVIIETEIAAGHSLRDRLAELHLVAGRLTAGLDRSQRAEDHFRVVLALRPEATLPEGTSPKIAVPFTVARTKSAPLTAKLLVTADAIAVEPVVDVLGLVAGIEVRERAGDRVETRREHAALRIARTPATTVVEVRALDRHGNVVWTGAPPAIAAPPIEQPLPITRDEPAFYARWSTWAVVTGVALVGGGVAAWRFDAAQNEFDDKRAAGTADFTELEAIERRGRRWGLAANISFGVAAATAITSVVLFLRRPDAEPAVTVTAGAGTVGIAGRF